MARERLLGCCKNSADGWHLSWEELDYHKSGSDHNTLIDFWFILIILPLFISIFCIILSPKCVTTTMSSDPPLSVSSLGCVAKSGTASSHHLFSRGRAAKRGPEQSTCGRLVIVGFPLIREAEIVGTDFFLFSSDFCLCMSRRALGFLFRKVLGCPYT